MYILGALLISALFYERFHQSRSEMPTNTTRKSTLNQLTIPLRSGADPQNEIKATVRATKSIQYHMSMFLRYLLYYKGL